MNTLRTAAQQALEALKIMQPEVQMGEGDAAIKALKAALAEPVQEPDNKADSIRWQLCLLAQTEEFSDEVRNQIARGVWLIDRLTEAALAEPENWELRRLREELERCKQVCAATSESWRTDAEKWKGQRDALLEALKTVEWHGGGSCWVVDADKIAAAIKAAEENT